MLRCGCCDRTLSETEIAYNVECDEWEFCGTCLFEISEVFGDGDVLSEEEIEYEHPSDFYTEEE